MLSCMIWSLNKEMTDQFYISLHWLRPAIRNLVQDTALPVERHTYLPSHHPLLSPLHSLKQFIIYVHHTGEGTNVKRKNVLTVLCWGINRKPPYTTFWTKVKSVFLWSKSSMEKLRCIQSLNVFGCLDFRKAARFLDISLFFSSSSSFQLSYLPSPPSR